jgi:hypothetical protein
LLKKKDVGAKRKEMMYGTKDKPELPTDTSAECMPLVLGVALTEDVAIIITAGDYISCIFD